MISDTITTWAWIGAAGMAAGTLPPLYRLATDGENARYYGVLAAITGIAAVAYAAMGLGLGTVYVDGQPVLLPRYVDWLLTTPLLVAYLGLLAGASRRTYAALLGVDVLIIGFGIAATLLAGTVRYLLFGAGSVAYLGLLYLLLRTLPAEASFASDRADAAFTKLRNLTVVLWTVYPVAWLLSTAGLGLMTLATTMVVIVYLDFISKVGFVAIAVRSADALDELRAAGPVGSAGPVEPAASVEAGEPVDPTGPTDAAEPTESIDATDATAD